MNTQSHLTFRIFILILHLFWHVNIKPEKKTTLLSKKLLQVVAFGKELLSGSVFRIIFLNSQML